MWSLPCCSRRCRSASASLIRRASRATTACIWATSSADSVKSGLSARSSRRRRSRLAVPPPRQLPLDVLPDQPPERLEPELHVGAEPGERARVHPLLLRGAQQGLEVRLDLLPRELVPDLAGEVADLEEVEEALESHPAPALPYRELERRGVGQEQHLRQGVDVEVVRLLEQALEQRPRPRILAAEGLGRLGPEPLQVEEIEVEDPLERREVARLLDEGRGERVAEVVAVPEPDRLGGLERVERLGGRHAHLRPSEVADELENPVVHD